MSPRAQLCMLGLTIRLPSGSYDPGMSCSECIIVMSPMSACNLNGPQEAELTQLSCQGGILSSSLSTSATKLRRLAAALVSSSTTDHLLQGGGHHLPQKINNNTLTYLHIPSHQRLFFQPAGCVSVPRMALLCGPPP